MNTCSVDGCLKPARSKSATLCPMHYHRQYRGKPIGTADELIRKRRNPECSISGCGKPDKEAGLCSMHAARKRRHGDPEIVIGPQDRQMPTGPAHPLWAGLSVGYGAAHDRVKRLKGSASKYSCVECGSAAQHWSYNHDDPEEVSDYVRSVSLVAYSAKPEHYSPRCVPCHKRFDLQAANPSLIYSEG